MVEELTFYIWAKGFRVQGLGNRERGKKTGFGDQGFGCFLVIRL